MAQKLILPINKLRITAGYKTQIIEKNSATLIMDVISQTKQEQIRKFGQVVKELFHMPDGAIVAEIW